MSVYAEEPPDIFDEETETHDLSFDGSNSKDVIFVFAGKSCAESESVPAIIRKHIIKAVVLDFPVNIIYIYIFIWCLLSIE